jgi:hypothetical protein
VAITNGYLTLAALKLALGDTGSTNDEAYERAIEAASRQIDEFRGDQFWLVATPTPRLYRPTSPDLLWTGDFSTTTGLVVEVDEDEDGDYETVWVAADYSAEPLVRLPGRPFDRLVAIGENCWPMPHYTNRPTVRVTARWGWPAVPKEVEQACQILAIDHFKSKDLTGGIAGFNDLGAVRISAFNPQARALLAPYKLP